MSGCSLRPCLCCDAVCPGETTMNPKHSSGWDQSCGSCPHAPCASSHWDIVVPEPFVFKRCLCEQLRVPTARGRGGGQRGWGGNKSSFPLMTMGVDACFGWEGHTVKLSHCNCWQKQRHGLETSKKSPGEQISPWNERHAVLVCGFTWTLQQICSILPCSAQQPDWIPWGEQDCTQGPP